MQRKNDGMVNCRTIAPWEIWVDGPSTRVFHRATVLQLWNDVHDIMGIQPKLNQKLKQQNLHVYMLFVIEQQKGINVIWHQIKGLN